ncbi:envoplakin a [Lampris incognitus]|uniref:envoplakin a n=1 Tax=Lampris incognitus TaxID=2546036 RepID=UPI0024B5E484|nr:envoplakin a [Lampris incognitus]
MFKKKDSKENTVKVAGKLSKSQASNLALLIARMQKNADQLEKDVLRAEELLALEAENEKKELPLQHQEEISDKLGESEGLLKDLFLDVDKAKKLKHPQAKDIESDVSLLHKRWLKDYSFYREIYDQVNDVSLMPRIDWAPLLNQKQKEVNAEEYGPTMSDLEKQIASHNILHKEIEAYSSQLSPSSAGSKEEYIAIKKQYNNLLDNSKWRRHYLSSLYDYMQGCNKELAFLGEEQQKIKNQDWSDRMVDPPDVRRQYENFKNNSLLSHESEVNKLQDDADRLVELKHPASSTIQAQRDAVRNEWQKFLNLCICQETHLDNVEDFKKYQLDTEQLSETLTMLNKSMDPKTVSKRSNSENLLQLEAEERDVQRSEQLLADLRRRSTTIAPLKLRRAAPSRPTTVESLCDWETDKASLSREDRLTLKSNSNNENWDIVSSDGTTKTFPGVCFLIPPPDSEAIDKVDLLGGELADIKKRRAALSASLKNHKTDVSRSQQAAPVSSAPLDPKAVALTDQLNKLDGDLAETEKGILSRLRAPLNRSDPAGDLANRLREQKKAAEVLKALEQQKKAAQVDLQPLLSEDPSGTSSALPIMLSATSNKHDGITALADLYTKKANASLNLESQIKKVDGIVSVFEKKLSEDGAISDAPNSIQDHAQEIQNLRKAVVGSQDEIKKMGQDLETTEQLCSSLQQGYQEYCPDIQRQGIQVKQLQNRHANVTNQLKESENLLQDAASKNQEFQNTCKSLNSFLDNLPKNQISPNDDIAKVNAKQTSQERVMDDLKRRGDSMDRVVDLSQDLQNLLNEYEANVDKYNSTLDDAGATVAKRPHASTLADAVQKQEKALVNRYAETSSENNQRLNQMELAKNLIAQNEEKFQVVAHQQVQLESQQRNSIEVDGLKKDLQEENDRRTHAETDLQTFKERMLSLKSRRGVERVEEKEVLQYYRDPKLESDLVDLQNSLHEQALKRSTTQGEIEIINKKLTTLEDTLKNAPPKLVTREVTEYEKDPQLDVEAAKLKDELERIKNEIRTRDGETFQMKTEVTILQQKKPLIKERVVKKEVMKVEKDPEMLKATRMLETEISEEGEKTKLVNDEIFQTRSQINALERIIPTIQPKIITKEVKKIEQDPELINETKKIISSIEDESIENNSLTKEIATLQNRYHVVQDWKPRVEVKEIVNEIYHIDPNTEMEIMRLKKEIQSSSKQRSDLERETSVVTSELNGLRFEKPKVEIKEVLQEVVKEERSPENEREIQRLNDQLNHLHSSYNAIQDKLRILRRDRDEWKAEKSKVETKLVTREVVRYEDDPLQEKEADRLRREVREEAQLRRTTEEMVFDLQNKYILLERQKPEERVVVQEMVRLQKDPRQIVEHDRLSRSLDEEVKTRRQLELELQQLKTKVEDREKILRESDEHQRKIQVESELRQIRIRIKQLENTPPPIEESIVVEEVLKVERDPKLERLTNGLRSGMDKETNDILRLQREIRNINVKLEILQREKSGEKTVYKEVVRVEKDQAVEAERERLREQVSQEKFARQDVEDEIKRLSDKINFLRTTMSSNTREETSLILNRDTLQKDRDNFICELRNLEAQKHDITLSFQQQTRLMSEKTQMSRQRSLKMESDIRRLEKDILDEKDRIHLKDNSIRELQLNIEKEENTETRTRETNVSTKITILDPETGKDMSPYDAYLQGLIDRQQYIHLQELECDWEEITSMGPDGETSVLQDRKSGKQYSINNALKDGRLTQYDLQRYKSGQIPISEFALLVAGDMKKPPQLNSVIPRSTTTSVKSAQANSTAPTEMYPIAGVMDTNTDTCFTVRSATMRKLIDITTAQRLLEAQAATGGIIDINTRERHSVHKAAERGLIEGSQLQRLLNAHKAFTGVEDPMTKERLSVGEAVQKGWMPKDTAIRYMEAQHLTGGLVNPNTNSRVNIIDAIGAKMIDSTMMRELQSDTNYAKEIIDPITKEKINYKQAMDRCKRDPLSGLPMLPASSKDSGYTPMYTSHRYSRY